MIGPRRTGSWGEWGMKRRKSEMRGGGEAATANGVGLTEGERWESGEKEGVGSREASDSSTAGRRAS